MVTSTSRIQRFVHDLREEALAHPAIRHSFLRRISTETLPRSAFLEFALQLYPHCHMFITYMEKLLCNAPDSPSKLCIAKILLDEYGEDAQGDDHPALFRRFLHAAGASDRDIMQTPLDPASVQLVRRHLAMCGQQQFLVGLGAIGPGHELTIPSMFPPLCEGMRRAGFSEHDIQFFTLHSDHDVEHSKMMEESIAQLAQTSTEQELVLAGMRGSLEERARFWSSVERRVFDSEAPAPAHHAQAWARAGLSRCVVAAGRKAPWARVALEPLRQTVAHTLADFVG